MLHHVRLAQRLDDSVWGIASSKPPCSYGLEERLVHLKRRLEMSTIPVSIESYNVRQPEVCPPQLMQSVSATLPFHVVLVP